MERGSVNRDSERQFEEFVSAVAHRFLRTAYLLTGDRGHAEDLLQTTLERTARRWSRVSAEPEPYARKIMTRLAIDRWRRLASRPKEDLGRDSDIGETDRSAQVAERHALVAALGTLSRQQRAVIVLRYFDDLSESDTAHALGISVGTVKSTASRALARLRDIGQAHDLFPRSRNESQRRSS